MNNNRTHRWNSARTARVSLAYGIAPTFGGVSFVGFLGGMYLNRFLRTYRVA